MKGTTTQSQNAALAYLFSSGAIRELAHKGHSPLVGRLLAESGLIQCLDSNCTLSKVYDQAFSILKAKDYRHEYIYKNAIAQKILLGKHSLNTSSMLTEFRAGSCKADVVILNGTSVVYEIKSEKDNLDRLEKQLLEYLGIFDQIYVITGECHVASLLKVIPEEIGIQILTNRFQISEYRPAVSNVSNVSPEQIFESLQRSEYLAILQKNGIGVPNLPNTRIHTAAKELFVTLTPEQAHSGMVEILKQTRNPISLRQFVQSVPDSLRAAAISVPLSNSERSCFLSALNTDLETVLEWMERN